MTHEELRALFIITLPMSNRLENAVRRIFDYTQDGDLNHLRAAITYIEEERRSEHYP